MKKYYILILTVFCPLMSIGQEIIHMGSKREIFVDHYFIDKLNGLSIQMHHPYDEGPVMFFDKPWEGAFSAYISIIKEDDLYRAYYRGIPKAGQDGNESEVTCYAQSKDGINWEKPNLGLYEVEGSTNNNVILAHAAPVTHNFSPFLDANPKALPEEKYKALGGTQPSGLIAYVSADGLHWKKKQEQAVIQGYLDTQNVSFWSEEEQCYLCYSRDLTNEWKAGTIRLVCRATSSDFINWTPFVRMTSGDAPLEQLYTNQTSPYFRAPHIYVAIGGRFFPGKRILSEEQAKHLHVDPAYFKDCSDAFFMTSRGGNTYNRTFMEAFIRPGIGLNNWVSRSNYPALNVVQTSATEMSIYVGQDYAQPSAHLRRYSLRLDGFTSISAPYKGGEVLTKPFTFTGNELEINYSTSAAGEIRFEIQDEKGKAIAGYTLDESEIIIGNEIERVVSWKGKTDLKDLISKTIRLRIYMKDADLYSLKFRERVETAVSTVQKQTMTVRKVKDVVIYEDSKFFNAFPSVVKRPDGELLVAFRRAPDRRAFGEKGNSHVDPNSYLVMVRSKDGETWTREPELIYAHPFGGSQDPCLLQLRDGTLLCTSYAWAFIKPEGIENLKIPLIQAGGATFLGGYVLRSKDGGKSWQGPIVPPAIEAETGYTPFGNKLPAYNRGALYEGKSGRIFWAIAANDNASTDKISVYLLTSDDQGVSWTYRCPIAIDEKASFNETSVYETPKGDIIAFLRTANFDDQACIARSTDGGKSFKWESMGFQGHPLNALRLPDNRVLLTYGYRHPPYGIRARILNAECTDFATSEEFILRDDGGSGDIGYSWPVQLDEKRAMVVYYFNKNDGNRHIAGTIIEVN